MSREWVIVLSTSNEIDANRQKGYLEQEQIKCIMESSIFRPRSEVPLFSQYRLKVPPEQADAAKKILEELGEKA